MKNQRVSSQSNIAYYIDFSVQEIPSIAFIAYSTGRIIYTDSKTTCSFLRHDHPELHTEYFNTVDEIKQHMMKHGIRVILYPDYHIRYFKDLPEVKHVQVFHGTSDKIYDFQKAVLDYDLFFIPGNEAYERYKKKGLLKKGTGILIGYPKLDRVFNGELNREEELLKLGLDPHKKTVLYAPTWVDKAYNSSWKKFRDAFKPGSTGKNVHKHSTPAESTRHSRITGESIGHDRIPGRSAGYERIPGDINLIVKLHPNLKRYREHEVEEFKLQLAVRKNTRIFDTLPDIVPLMAASNVLVGDVSSVTREYLALKRPFVFLSNKPKWLWSAHKTKLWECGEVITDPKKLWHAVERALTSPQKYIKAIERHFQNTFYMPDGKAAERARDAVYSILNTA